ncbi:MAG: hypothetical protein ABIS35_15560, partial [Terracoccus sp.]
MVLTAAVLGTLTSPLLPVAAQAAGVGSDAGGGPTRDPYSPAYGHAYRHGVVPTRELNTQMHRWEAQTKGA